MAWSPDKIKASIHEFEENLSFIEEEFQYNHSYFKPVDSLKLTNVAQRILALVININNKLQEKENKENEEQTRKTQADYALAMGRLLREERRSK